MRVQQVQRVNGFFPTTHSQVIRKQVVLAHADVVVRLQLNEGAETIFLETLRQVDGKTFCVSSHFLPSVSFLMSWKAMTADLSMLFQMSTAQ